MKRTRKGVYATVEYPGQTRNAKIIDGEYSVGDYVFVTAQIVVQKISHEEAIASLKAWDSIDKSEEE